MFSFFFTKKQSPQIHQEETIIVVTLEGMEKLYEYIQIHSGIVLDKDKVLIQKKIITFCETHKINSFLLLLEKLKKDRMLWNEFIDIVTINETYFFREKQQLEEALKKSKDKKPLTILCAPSSSGEEVYTIVILALEMGLHSFKVVGIDLSYEAIQKAKEALYSKRSVHRVPQNILEKYFSIQGDNYKILDKLKQYTDFLECNIFEDTIYSLGKFDIIFSRNMFIYFNDERKVDAYKRLEKLKKTATASIHLGHADVSSSLANYIKGV